MTVVNKAPLNHLIDQLLVDYKTPADIIGENGSLKQLTKAILGGVSQNDRTVMYSASGA